MTRRQYVIGIVALVFTAVFFILPFVFIMLMAVKTKAEASDRKSVV